MDVQEQFDQLGQEVNAQVRMKQQLDRETMAKYREVEVELVMKLRFVQAKQREASTQ